MSISEDITKKFKAVAQTIDGQVQETKIFNSLREARAFIAGWYEKTSGAVNGDIQEVHAIPETVIEKVKAEIKAGEADAKAVETKVEEEVKKVLDKAPKA